MSASEATFQYSYKFRQERFFCAIDYG